MSVRFKVLLACLVLLACTVGLGVFSYYGQNQLGDVARNVYDNTLMGTKYEESAHVKFLRFVAGHHENSALTEDDRAMLAKVVDEVDVAIERAMTEKTKTAANNVRTKIAALEDKVGVPVEADDIATINKGMDQLANKYAGDGSNYRDRIDQLIDNSNKFLKWAMSISTLLTLVVATLLIRTIVPPLRQAVHVANAIAEGRLDNEINAKGRSETALLLQSLSVMQSSIAENLRQVKDQTAHIEHQAAERAERQKKVDDAIEVFRGTADESLNTVFKAAETMQASSRAMSTTAGETSKRVMTVASASEQAAANVQAVASAAEELNASFGEVAQRVEQSTQIATNAAQQATQTNDIIGSLSAAAERIGEVVNLINSIASQTNLLALNATIEAARAGEAGKGFAVVANEVKSLANQTAKATDDIRAQVSTMQNETKQAVDAVRAISDIVGKINEISGALSSSIEQQKEATQEIARNVQQAAAGTGEVSSNITGVAAAASETGDAAADVLNVSGRLSEQAAVLRRAVEDFFGHIKSA